jgi:single-strand DNA-binding protein
MPAFNQVIEVGNFCDDPQLSYTPNQTAVVDVSLAVNESWTAQDGTKREETLFIDVRIWGKLAEIVAKYTRKGSCVMVVGKLKLERWEKDGTKHSKHRLVAERVQFLTPVGSKVEASGQPREEEEIPF